VLQSNIIVCNILMLFPFREFADIVLKPFINCYVFYIKAMNWRDIST